MLNWHSVDMETNVWRVVQYAEFQYLSFPHLVILQATQERPFKIWLQQKEVRVFYNLDNHENEVNLFCKKFD